MQILIGSGSISSLMQGLLGSTLYLCDSGSVPESGRWNFGRTQSRSCRIYVCGCLLQCLFLKMYARHHNFPYSSILMCIADWNRSGCNFRYFDRNSCSSTERRLSCDRDIWRLERSLRTWSMPFTSAKIQKDFISQQRT